VPRRRHASRTWRRTLRGPRRCQRDCRPLRSADLIAPRVIPKAPSASIAPLRGARYGACPVPGDGSRRRRRTQWIAYSIGCHNAIALSPSTQPTRESQRR
jgi:hypothetical protein